MNGGLRWRRALAGVLFLTLLAFAGSASSYYVWVLRPWLVMPSQPVEEIASRWSEVLSWGSVPSQAGAESLRRALDALGSEDSRRAAEALHALDGWSAEGGIGDPCAMRSVRQLVSLGDAALGSEDAEVHATRVLQLGAALRRQGGYTDAAVGFALAERVLVWALEHPEADLADALVRYRPQDEELFFSMARDAVCTQRRFEAAQGLDLPARGITAASARPWGLDLLVRPSREALWLRKHNADRLKAAHPSRADAKATSALLAVDFERLPKSPAVRVLSISPTEAPLRTLDAFAQALD